MPRVLTSSSFSPPLDYITSSLLSRSFSPELLFAENLRVCVSLFVLILVIKLMIINSNRVK